MTGRPLLGLLAALLVEARYWVRLRWDFNDSSYESAWQLSFVMTVLAAVVIWLDESRYTAVMVLVGWLPLLLLPLQFVQSYGLRDSVQMAAFSLLARRSRLRNKRLGLIVDPVEFNFGNVTFVVILLSAAVGMESGSAWLFLPGLIILCGWVLLATGRCKWPSLLPVMLLAGMMAFGGQHGLEYLEKLIRQGGGDYGHRYNPNYQSTRIGSRGRVMLSADIVWRLKAHRGTRPPRLVRTSTFSDFLALSWQNRRRPFEALNTHSIGDEDYHLINPEIDATNFIGLPRYDLRGSVERSFPLPLAGNAVGVEGLKAQQVEKNQLGTVMVEPMDPVVDAAIVWGSDSNPEAAPELRDGTFMSESDRRVIRRALAEVKLSEVPTVKGKLARLDRWFLEHFRYTLDLTIRQPTAAERARDAMAPSALEQFLTDVRAGHCEYFATAATLMLRESGLPARYAVGYAVMEKDHRRDDYVIRGTHGHAWVRVWDAQSKRWFDYDPTPPDWMSLNHREITMLQRVKDWLKRLREDFFLWRTSPENELMVILVVSALGVGLSTFVIRRLWHSRSRIEADSQIMFSDWPRVDTPLHALERIAEKHLGQRPPGKPFASWMAELKQSCGPLRELDEALEIHQRWRFDPQPISNTQQQRLAELVTAMDLQLRQRLKLKP